MMADNGSTLTLYPKDPGDYGDYLSLLGHDLMESDDTIDIVVVPQGRPAKEIVCTAGLAGAIGATLLSLCSHEAQAEQVAEVLDGMPNPPARWFAVDMPPGYMVPGVNLRAEHEIPGIVSKDRAWNLSDKRNAGLTIGRMVGSESIFFCDDDLEIKPEAARSAAKMLFKRAIAGLRCGGFPDKSMIMHATQAVSKFHWGKWYRRFGKNLPHDLKAGQLSANSLAVNPRLIGEHFPRRIYNEDWLFAYDIIRRGLAGLSERHYYQTEYDPFDPERARQEEFGEIVIDGLYGDLKHQRQSAADAADLRDPTYWQSMIAARRQQYDHLLLAIDTKRSYEQFNYSASDEDMEKVWTMPEEQRNHLKLPLQAGLDVNKALDGGMFAAYTRVWQEDQTRWRRMLEALPSGQTIDGALVRLGLTDYITNV